MWGCVRTYWLTGGGLLKLLIQLEAEACPEADGPQHPQWICTPSLMSPSTGCISMQAVLDQLLTCSPDDLVLILRQFRQVWLYLHGKTNAANTALM